MKKFGIIGFGKMGHALLAGMASVIDCPVVICDISEQSMLDAHKLGLHTFTTTTSINEVAQTCDVVLLAVKPAQAPDVLAVLQTGTPKTILSIVAGLTTKRIAEIAPDQTAVRIMPNTPALVGKAACVVVDNDLTDDIKKLVTRLLTTAGSVHFVKSEAMLDAVTGLSGSGPALFAIIAEALADAAVAEGLPRTLANDLARETMLGTAALLEKEHPAILKENVMSPGGTTAAGIIAAEKAGLRTACQAFVQAATQKSRQL